MRLTLGDQSECRAFDRNRHTSAVNCGGDHPPTAHCSREAMSSILMSGIASYSVRFAVSVGVARSSGWAAGIIADAGVDC